MAYVNVSSDAEFEKVLSEKDLVVVDFWAPWCGPCRMFGPIFEEVSDEVSDVKFVKVNVDEGISIAEKFGIKSIPTVILFRNGEPVKQENGVLSKDQLIEFINN